MSQHFDIQQQQPGASSSNTTIVENNKWIPQPSTNLFKTPHIIEFTPVQGQEGDNFRADIRQQDLVVDMNLLRIAFNVCFTTCHFTLNTVTQTFSIHTQVPNSNLISCNDLSRVPIYLAVVQQNSILDSWFIGYFNYFSRKRSSADFDTDESKRSRSEQQAQYNLTNYYGISQHVPYVGLPPTQPSPRSREFFEDPLLNYSTTTNTNTDYRSNDPTFQTSFNDPSFISPTQSTTQSQDQSFMMPVMDALSSSSTNILPNQPPLQMKPIQPTQPIQQTVQPNVDPFANLLNKPILTIEGDLEHVLLNWKPEEWESQRRLVQFWRRQEGNEIFCRFENYDLPDEATRVDYNRMIIISCIYWEKKKDYFITSVDCIYLLEQLIGVKFTVEEKNRIRRNLEGYKPLTVSKLKPESADFFKLIMGFPNPKPRNIEKDLKVFAWSTLEVALKKIISKYTASYSSTASVNYDVLTSTTTSTNQQANNNNEPQVQ